MKILLRILGGLAALVLVLMLAAFALPRNYRVERSVTIQAKPEAVYANVGDLRAWRKWTVWHARDPQMKLSFSENPAAVGGWSAWESKTEGNGKMTLKTAEPGKRVVYKLEFPDMGMASEGSMELRPEGNAVKVVWADAGDLGMNPLSRWFGLLLDGMLGPDFERGLAKLKAVTEAAAK